MANEIGLDSIEAFRAVATLRELRALRIPDDIDSKAFATISKISAYSVKTYGADTVKAVVGMDAWLAEMNDTSKLS